MISCDLKKQGKGKNAGTLLQIEGEMTIEHAAELKQALLDLFAAAGLLSIDCVKVERVDLMGLQLLSSALHSAAEQERELTLDLSGQQAFQAAISRAGFPNGWCGIVKEES